MQHNRAGGAGHRAIKRIQVAKQIAVKQTEQRNVGNRGQARRVLMHLREVIVTDAFLAALAIAINKSRLKSFLQRALVQIRLLRGVR